MQTTINKDLSYSEIMTLNNYLIKPSDKLNVFWVDGYICAISSSPLPYTLNDVLNILVDGFKFEGTEITELITRFYNSINEAVINKSYAPIYDLHTFYGKTKLELATHWSIGYWIGTIDEGEEFLEIDELQAMLRPIIISSGIIPESELRANNVSRTQMIEQIPTQVKMISDLYDIIRVHLQQPKDGRHH